MLMILSKESVLEFAWIQGSESVSKNIKHCKITQMYAKLSPLVCVSLRRNFYLYARLHKFLKAESNQYLRCENRKHSRELCEQIRKSTRTLNMTILEIFYLYAHQNFSSVCKTAKYRKRGEKCQNITKSHKHSRIRAKTYPKSARTIIRLFLNFRYMYAC